MTLDIFRGSLCRQKWRSGCQCNPRHVGPLFAGLAVGTDCEMMDDQNHLSRYITSTQSLGAWGINPRLVPLKGSRCHSRPHQLYHLRRLTNKGPFKTERPRIV